MRDGYKTRPVTVGHVRLGGDSPVRVQGMAKADTRDVPMVSRQLQEMTELGCEIARVAVPDQEAVEALAQLKRQVTIPLVADIHFDYRLALAAIQAGADKLRINPGNIGDTERVQAIVEAARQRRIPIRIGVNAGSLEKHLLLEHGGPRPEALVESALGHCRLLTDEGFEDIVLSVKSSSVTDTIAAYRSLAHRTVFPLHLGVTEAGTLVRGTVKSAVGMGVLLSEGIGDTLRISLAASPADEIRIAYHILSALNLRRRGVEVVACPTCGRCEIDIRPIAQEVEKRLSHVTEPLTVAVMGCPVNGPGEAKHADVGIACSRSGALLFVRGKVIDTVDREDMVQALLRQVNDLLAKPSMKEGIICGGNSNHSGIQ